MVSAGDPPPEATAARDAAPAVAFRFEPRPSGRPRNALARWLLQGLHHGAAQAVHPTDDFSTRPCGLPRKSVENPLERPRIHVG